MRHPNQHQSRHYRYLQGRFEENLRKNDKVRKTNIVAGLSVGFSRVLAVLVITLLLLIVLGVFAFAFVVLLGEKIGSMSGAAFIVGSVYLIAALVLIFLRKRLFVNMFSNLFSGIIDHGSPADDLKPLLLKLVRNIRSNLED